MIPIDFVTYVGATETIRLSRPVFDQMLDAFGTRMLVEAVRGGRPEQKRNLMGICWQATFKPAHRKEKNAQPNGLFALDIDHIGHDAVTDLWQRTMNWTSSASIAARRATARAWWRSASRSLRPSPRISTGWPRRCRLPTMQPATTWQGSSSSA